ncbi:MAG: M12 family metallo-peptidase, partial [Lacibacter sp.]
LFQSNLIMFTNRLITLTRPGAYLLALILIFFLFTPAKGQNVAKPIASWLEAHRPIADFVPVSLFQEAAESTGFQQIAQNSQVLELDDKAITALQLAPPSALQFSIPTADGATLELELIQVEILGADFFVSTNTQEQVAYKPAVHYRGIVRGNPQSIACISLSNEGVMGMVSDENGVFELGQLEDGSGRYLYYPTQQLQALSPNHCFAEEESLFPSNDDAPAAGDRGVGCKTVQVYFECDYKLYTDKGSNTTTVSNYVTGLFNQIATLYANENVGIAISQIYVWTSSDPYVGYSSTSAVLNAFRQTRGSTFNGNLAHLLTTRSLGGGIAYVDVLCVKQYAFGVSSINTSYQNVPTYSWSVEVVTHELGHNLGSWHTQSCNWPGGALDNCVSPEGSCAPGPTPVNGGTIMSYCHLTGHGINFTKGFGPSPGGRIRDKVLSATCVTQSGTVPGGLSTANITANSATLNWNPVQGATSYTVQYKLSSAGSWILAGNSSSATFNLTGLVNNSAYQWQVKTDCSNYSVTASFTTGTGGGGGGISPYLFV